MKLVEILNVHQGETHTQHPPGRLTPPDPERRFFTSIEIEAEIKIREHGPYRFRRWSTYYGPDPSVSLRRAYVGISRHLPSHE